MKTSIEIVLQPMHSIEVVSQSPPEIVIDSSPATSLEVSLATIGPAGPQGSPGQVVGVDTVVGDPNASYATMYQIFKL